MRIWHTKLLPVLPKKYVVAQWHDLTLLATKLVTRGTPNDPIVDFIMDYDLDHFISYAHYVRLELQHRNLKTRINMWRQIVDLWPDWKCIPLTEVYKEKMSDFYLKICYYHLLEEYSCEAFDDFSKIEQVCKDVI